MLRGWKGIFDQLMRSAYTTVLWYAVSARHRELLSEQKRKWTFDPDLREESQGGGGGGEGEGVGLVAEGG